MTEDQFNRLLLWQSTAATFTNDFERYCAASEEFGNDQNFIVWLDGTVNFIDRANGMTFGEYCDDNEDRRYYRRLNLLRQRN